LRFSSVANTAAVLTAFYSWRLLFMTFHGAPRAPAAVMAHVHESPRVMTIPLILLAVGATFAGLAGLSMVEGSGEFWRGSIFVLPEHDALAEAHHVSFLVKILPVIGAAAGSPSPVSCSSGGRAAAPRRRLSPRSARLVLGAVRWLFVEPTTPGTPCGGHRRKYRSLRPFGVSCRHGRGAPLPLAHLCHYAFTS
jgi:hypothetical protein